MERWAHDSENHGFHRQRESSFPYLSRQNFAHVESIAEMAFSLTVPGFLKDVRADE